jgi:hypothetical protein
MIGVRRELRLAVEVDPVDLEILRHFRFLQD